MNLDGDAVPMALFCAHQTAPASNSPRSVFSDKRPCRQGLPVTVITPYESDGNIHFRVNNMLRPHSSIVRQQDWSDGHFTQLLLSSGPLQSKMQCTRCDQEGMLRNASSTANLFLKPSRHSLPRSIEPCSTVFLQLEQAFLKVLECDDSGHRRRNSPYEIGTQTSIETSPSFFGQNSLAGIYCSPIP